MEILERVSDVYYNRISVYLIILSRLFIGFHPPILASPGTLYCDLVVGRFHWGCLLTASSLRAQVMNMIVSIKLPRAHTA